MIGSHKDQRTNEMSLVVPNNQNIKRFSTQMQKYKLESESQTVISYSFSTPQSPLISSTISTMKFFVVLAVCVVVCSARSVQKRGANGDQKPKVWDALKALRGGKDLSIEDIQGILANAVSGKDYPANAEVPAGEVNCGSYKQPGFYADDSDKSRCQVFHRCDENGVATSYLCPNQTLFNQITLICDWFYNIDCSQSKTFQDYSNSRLYQEGLLLLDDQMEIAEATGAAKVEPAVSKGKGKGKGKKN